MSVVTIRNGKLLDSRSLDFDFYIEDTLLNAFYNALNLISKRKVVLPKLNGYKIWSSFPL